MVRSTGSSVRSKGESVSSKTVRENGDQDRGVFERTVLLDTLSPLLRTEDPADRTIASCLRAIEGYEKGAAVLQQIFDALLWGLLNKSGQAERDEILKLPRVSRVIEGAVANARTVSRDLQKVVANFKDVTVINASARAQAIELILD